jgi:hypothetical protein
MTALTFTKFDPHAFLKGEKRSGAAVKSAKVATAAKREPEQRATFAAFATFVGAQCSNGEPASKPAPELIAPSPWFERIAPPAEDEPGFEMPCATRRGRVEDRDGVLLHFCCECGAWGAFGYDVNLRAGRLGKWYCVAHRPQQPSRDVTAQTKMNEV